MGKQLLLLHLLSLTAPATICSFTPLPQVKSFHRIQRLCNVYDDWRSDAVVVDTLVATEENVVQCLDELMDSDFGQQMFGVHPLALGHHITGTISLVELVGQEVVLHLEGAFWHKRSTVLGQAAMWIHARMPTITSVSVADKEELSDSEEIVDDSSGEYLFTLDKRAPDFNGDRATMEYKGINPDISGPFPKLLEVDSMILPAR